MSISRPIIPLTNTQRILILQEYESRTDRFLSDLEKVHFNTSARSEMRPIFFTKIGEKDGAFDDLYDEYLLALWDELQTPPVEPGSGGESGVPIGFMNLGITYA